MTSLMKSRAGLGASSVLAAVLLALVPSTAGATAVAPTALYEYPSSDSTVVASVGFIDDDEIGYFWSAARGDRVTETFSGPPAVRGAILKVEVVSNVLNSGAHVDWRLEINGVPVGGFRVREGFTGPIRLVRQFSPIPGPNYEVTIRVMNEVAGGEGSHTLAYAGAFFHQLRLGSA